MGALLPIPSGFILILDGCLGGIALYFGRLFGASSKIQYFTFLVGLFSALCGFVFAEELYQEFVFTTPKSFTLNPQERVGEAALVLPQPLDLSGFLAEQQGG